jgi:hypothetical protein
VSIRLIVEVLDHAPAELSPTERMVLVAIAEKANDGTREAHGAGVRDEVIAERCGLAVESLTNVFRRLARHGVEVRVPLAFTAHGRPLFACNGRQKTYRIPPLEPRSPVTEPGFKTGPATGPGAEDRSRNTEDRSSDRAYPSAPSKNPQAAAARATEIVIENTDATDTEAAAVVDLIRVERKPHSIVGLLQKIARDGDLPDWLTRVRETSAEQQTVDNRAAIRAFRDAIAGEPPCDHGYAGGHLDGPGGPLCPIWRNRSAA